MMALVKICPNKKCGKVNPANEALCGGCFTDLSEVSPVSESTIPVQAPVNNPPETSVPQNQQPIADNEKTVISGRALVLREPRSGRTLTIRSGDILGRHNVGKEIFDSLPEVSRRHLMIHSQNSGWEAEDLGSTNGTQLNGTLLQEGKRYPLKTGDALQLANACLMEVQS